MRSPPSSFLTSMMRLGLFYSELSVSSRAPSDKTKPPQTDASETVSPNQSFHLGKQSLGCFVTATRINVLPTSYIFWTHTSLCLEEMWLQSLSQLGPFNRWNGNLRLNAKPVPRSPEKTISKQRMDRWTSCMCNEQHFSKHPHLHPCSVSSIHPLSY